MSSESEDSVGARDGEAERNGDAASSPAENGNDKENLVDDVIVEAQCREDPVKPLAKESLNPAEREPADTAVEEDQPGRAPSQTKSESVDSEPANGDHACDGVGPGKEALKGPQRRMSLRQRAAPKKYVEVQEESDEDPLAIPTPNHKSVATPTPKSTTSPALTASPTAAGRRRLEPTLKLGANDGKNDVGLVVATSPSLRTTPVKAPPLAKLVKSTSMTRPPPELIKAPTSTHTVSASAANAAKLAVSPATTVTVVPRSKENANPGFVIVDTQSILTGKGPVAVNTVPASVTVSAVPALSSAGHVLHGRSKSGSSVLVNRQKATASLLSSSSSGNAAAVTDPFEALGLEDDNFIVEAPSFVVPYLIEKPAPQDFKKFLLTMDVKKEPAASAKTPNEDVIDLSEDDSNDAKKDPPAKEGAADKPKTDAEKMAAPAAASAAPKSAASKEQDDYFAGPIGRFFLDIGLSLVQEYVQGDLLRVQKRKAHKGTKISDPSLSVAALTKGTLVSIWLTILTHRRSSSYDDGQSSLEQKNTDVLGALR